MSKTIKGYKGFDKNMQCRGFQYEEGKSYECDEAKACEKGFHLCEHPLDVFQYYPPSNSLFAEVEAGGEIDNNDNSGTKIACTKIKIGSKLSLQKMIEAAINFTFERATWVKGSSAKKASGAASATGDSGAASATGDSGAASATGYSGAASATGYRGAASATGDRGAASATGKDSIACGLGVDCRAMGAIDCWIVLAERFWNGTQYEIKTVQTAKVDGKKIKAMTWYKLQKGEFVECN